MRRMTSKTARMAARSIPQGAACILEHENGSALYTYEHQNIRGTRYLVIAFWGTSARAQFHDSYRTAEERQVQILRWKTSVESSVASRVAARAEKKAWTNPLTVGTILYTSWGYDQTNVEFTS